MTTTMQDPAPPQSRLSSAFSVLQRVGRSLMMPIAVLPAAGLLYRFGQDDLLGAHGLGGALPGCSRWPASWRRPAPPCSTTSRCCSPWGWRSASPASPTAPPRWRPWSATSSSTT
ncbi:hypothetical protein ACFQ0B_02240 [Nonomuraea thailandensis]